MRTTMRWAMGCASAAAAIGVAALTQPNRAVCQPLPEPLPSTHTTPQSTHSSTDSANAPSHPTPAASLTPPPSRPIRLASSSLILSTLDSAAAASFPPPSPLPLPSPDSIVGYPGFDQPLTEKQRKKCEQWKDKAIKTSRKVNYMFRAMDRAGCHVDPWRFIQCVSCPISMSGALTQSAPEEDHAENETVGILMCGNRLKSYDHFETVLTHELIHAYDHCRAEINIENLHHHACMEVRAANLSGDCTFMRQLKIGKFGLMKEHQSCVRRRSALSLLSNPACGGEASKAHQAVEDVFERCISDTEPFGSVPW